MERMKAFLCVFVFVPVEYYENLGVFFSMLSKDFSYAH